MSCQKSDHSTLRLIPCLKKAKSIPNNESGAKNLSHGWLNRPELEVSQQLRDTYCNSRVCSEIILLGQRSSSLLQGTTSSKTADFFIEDADSEVKEVRERPFFTYILSSDTSDHSWGQDTELHRPLLRLSVNEAQQQLDCT